ncbi:MAG: biotin transporter BioY [Bacteroidetes bacterium]|nr:biotin transporter BioY [Bacteroidota bacterium]
MKTSNVIREIIWTLLGFGFLYLMAGLSHNLVLGQTEIPLTGQSLAVLLIGFCWPGWSGVLAVVLYLLAGGLGLPVFAEGASGWGVFQGGTGGFLFGFLVAAWYLRRLKYRNWGRNSLMTLLAMILGTLFILGFGVLRLSQMYGFESGLKYGFLDLWPGALVKLLIATVLARLWYRFFPESIR